MSDSKHWVQCWGQSHAPLSLLKFPSGKRTFRLIVNTPISGEELRIRLSNKFGKTPVTVGAATAALCSPDGTVNATSGFCTLTYEGEERFTVYPGQQLYTDSVCFNVKPNEHIAVSFYVEGELTSGNSLDNAALLFCDGNCVTAGSFAHSGRTRDKVITKVTGILGLHHPLPIPLIKDVELNNKDGASAIVCFGDSLTQQGYWTNAFEKIIRENFPGKYSVINEAITGNRLMFDSKMLIVPGLFGPNAPSRLNDDVFCYENVTHAVICIGVNDMIQPGSLAAPPREFVQPYRYFEALTDFYLKFREKGIKTVGMNFPPFGTSPDSNEKKNEVRRAVNEWFDKSNADICDRYVDIYSITRSEDPDKAILDLLGPDHLHPNAIGGELLAKEIPLDIFEPSERKVTV